MQMNLTRWLVVLAALALPLGSVQAESETAARARADREAFQGALQAGLERIAFLRGARTLERMAHTADGRQVARPAISFDVQPVNGGKQLHTTANLDGYHYLMYWAYDPLLKRYTMVSMDDVSGLADIYHGGFEPDGALVLTNLESRTHYTYLGVDYHNRLRFQPGADGSLSLTVEYSPDRGATWKTQMVAKSGPAR